MTFTHGLVISEACLHINLKAPDVPYSKQLTELGLPVQILEDFWYNLAIGFECESDMLQFKFQFDPHVYAVLSRQQCNILFNGLQDADAYAVCRVNRIFTDFTNSDCNWWQIMLGNKTIENGALVEVKR